MADRYTLIFIPTGSFVLITYRGAAKAALKKFYDHLTEDSTFVFEADTPKRVGQLDTWRHSVTAEK